VSTIVNHSVCKFLRLVNTEHLASRFHALQMCGPSTNSCCRMPCHLESSTLQLPGVHRVAKPPANGPSFCLVRFSALPSPSSYPPPKHDEVVGPSPGSRNPMVHLHPFQLNSCSLVKCGTTSAHHAHGQNRCSPIRHCLCSPMNRHRDSHELCSDRCLLRWPSHDAANQLL